MSRLFKITGLLCRISSFLQGSFAKETYHSKEPTNRSHEITALTLGLRANVLIDGSVFLKSQPHSDFVWYI